MKKTTLGGTTCTDMHYYNGKYYINFDTSIQVHRRVLMSLYYHHYFGLYKCVCECVFAFMWHVRVAGTTRRSRHHAPHDMLHNKYVQHHSSTFYVCVAPSLRCSLQKRKHSMNYEISISFTVFNSVRSTNM